MILNIHRAYHEREARGQQLFRPGVQGPNVAAPPQIHNRIITRQQLPDHPPSRFDLGVVAFGRQPVTDTILVRQQLPLDHPASRFIPGVQGPNVAPNPMVHNRVLVRQELPWHPAPFFWRDPPPVKQQVPYFVPIRLTQEMPWHPGSRFHAGTPPVSYEDIEFFTIH